MEEEIAFFERRQKLEKLRQLGIDPYNGSFPATHTSAEIIASFAILEGHSVRVAGRLISLRLHGRASFAHLDDGEARIQIYLRSDELGADLYNVWAKLLDIGDILGVEGNVFKTRTGEITIAVTKFTLLSKALRPLPEKWHGLKDVELRYRQRYLDFLANPKTREIVRLRAKLISLVRSFLESRGFLEVETPILQPIGGGALAKPFITFHNALGINLYLRIAPELYLKRLIVAGFNKVFELGRYFRNEGISSTHNPEFTALEIYRAYADYQDMMVLTEEMVAHLAQNIFGAMQVELDGQGVDFTPPWPRLSLRDAFKQYARVDIEQLKDPDFCQKYLKENEIQVEKRICWANGVDEVLKKKIEPQIAGPLFLYDYPLELSPLARSKSGAPGWVERFQPILLGIEIGNAYSELADPIDQRLRFEEQLEARDRGDDEAHPMDEDFVVALEHGMPPTGGLGIGIDRLIMLFAQESSLREIIIFPTLRPKAAP